MSGKAARLCLCLRSRSQSIQIPEAQRFCLCAFHLQGLLNVRNGTIQRLAELLHFATDVGIRMCFCDQFGTITKLGKCLVLAM